MYGIFTSLDLPLHSPALRVCFFLSEDIIDWDPEKWILHVFTHTVFIGVLQMGCSETLGLRKGTLCIIKAP